MVDVADLSVNDAVTVTDKASEWFGDDGHVAGFGEGLVVVQFQRDPSRYHYMRPAQIESLEPLEDYAGRDICGI